MRVTFVRFYFPTRFVVVVGMILLTLRSIHADEQTGRLTQDLTVGASHNIQLKTGQVVKILKNSGTSLVISVQTPDGSSGIYQIDASAVTVDTPKTLPPAPVVPTQTNLVSAPAPPVVPVAPTIKPPTDATVQVDPTVKYQTFEGWGVSLCWWAKVVGSFPDETRNDYMDKIFDPKDGLGLTVIRYNIGGGENPSSNKLPFRANMEGFESAPGQWDWKADAGQRWVLKQAQNRGANLFEAFSNSPPYWMTVSGSVTGEKDGHDNLAPDHEKDFADYLATVLQHFHDHEGVNFRTLEPFNEPNSWWWQKGNNQEGCHFGHEAQARCIQSVAHALAGKNLTTSVSASDENSINDTFDSVRSYPQACLDLISQINTHSYNGEKRTELENFASAAHKILWQTEYGDGDASGLSLSNSILQDMHQMHPAAWIYWQAVDGPKWGLLTNTMDGTVSSPQIGKKYWVMANYSRFIHPGSVFIEAHDEQSLAAMNSKEGTVTIVTTNQKDHDETITYDLSRLDTRRAIIAVYRTSASEDLAPLHDINFTDTQFNLNLPAKSVTTMVLSGVEKR